jgi:hypothetical protein
MVRDERVCSAPDEDRTNTNKVMSSAIHNTSNTHAKPAPMPNIVKLATTGTQKASAMLIAPQFIFLSRASKKRHA